MIEKVGIRVGTDAGQRKTKKKNRVDESADKLLSVNYSIDDLINRNTVWKIINEVGAKRFSI